MNRVVACSLCAALLIALPLRAEKRKMAVMDLIADTELDRGTVKTLNEILLNEFTRSGQISVLGSSDIASMLSLQEEKVKVTGCADDSCLAEIGGALGVQLMGAARVGAVGEKYVITVKVLDVNQAAVLGRTSETLDRDDTALIAAIQNAVKTVLVQALGVPAGRAPESGLAAAPAEEPGGFWKVGPWIGLGLTVATGAAAAALAGLAYRDSQAAQDEFKGSAAWQDHKDDMERRSLGADVLFGVAGAAAVATILLFVLAPDEAPAASAAVVPVPGGGAASLTLRFR